MKTNNKKQTGGELAAASGSDLLLDPQQVADEVRQMDDATTRENAAWTIEQLIAAIVNIYRWTGSKRCARECKRVLPDVADRCQPNDQAHPPA
jgi:hypothetical protein